MNESLSIQSLRSAFMFPFENKDWFVPFLIGSGLLISGMFIPVIPIILVYGYFAQVMRIAIQGDELILPPWSNWGQLFKDGLRSLAVGAIYLGPGIIVSMIGFTAYIVMIIASIAMTPESPYDTTSSGLAGLLMLGAMATLFLSMFVGTLLLLAGAIPLPAALGNFISHDKLSAAFYLRQLGAILRADKWGYFIAWLIYLGMIALVYIGFMLAYFTFILCFLFYLLAIPLGFYMMVVTAVLFGQTYREGLIRSKPEDSGI